MNISRRFFPPPEAKAILDRMTGNRTRRKQHVETLAADMREGRWVDTHEPIAMSVDGNLIDGQHRLAAVVASGVGQWFWLAVYDTHQTAIGLPIDCGARRNTADMLGIDRKQAEVAAAIFRYGMAGIRTIVRPANVDRILEKWGQQIYRVMECSRGNKRVKGCATTRSAIAVNAILCPNDAESIYDEFSLWYNSENVTWESVKALNKQLDTIKKYRPEDLFLRIAKAFDPRRKSKEMLRMNAHEAALLQKEIREELTKLIC